jgi:hypothetical protein
VTNLTRIFLYAVTICIWIASSLTVWAADYSVISESEMQNYRRSIDVRLSKKVSEQDLRSIATELKKLESKAYERTFIVYYLPDMKVGAGAWATTHFDPELEIRILGLTLDQEEKMGQDAASDSRNLVGVWADERPYVGARLTLYREYGKLYLETKYGDGSGSLEEMGEAKSATGTKMVEKGGNSHGEYFMLDGKGNLQAGGGDGIFLKYKKVK